MYQGKGIFPFLVRKAKSHAKIVYSFPNKKSLPIFIHKLGWKQKETLDQLLYIIDAAKLARRKGKHFFLMKLITKKPHISSNSSILLRKITTFDKKTTSLWKKISKSDIITVRDQAYLSWRFIKNPTANYTIYRAEKNNEITGYIVLKTNGITGTVIDILSIDNETLDALIAKSVDHFKLTADVVHCNLSTSHPYYNRFKKHGFMRNPFVRDEPKLVVNTENFNRWSITNSDRNDI